MSVSQEGKLPRDKSGSKVQVFNPYKIEAMAGAGNFTVGDSVSIMSDTDVTIYFGTATTKTFALSANIPLGVTALTTVHVDAACNLLVM